MGIGYHNPVASSLSVRKLAILVTSSSSRFSSTVVVFWPVWSLYHEEYAPDPVCAN